MHTTPPDDMFTIEHDFDATIVTLMDDGGGAVSATLQEDVKIASFDDRIVVEQFDPTTNTAQKITLSISQIRDLAVALNLPEGVYRLDHPNDA